MALNGAVRLWVESDNLRVSQKRRSDPARVSAGFSDDNWVAMVIGSLVSAATVNKRFCGGMGLR